MESLKSKVLALKPVLILFYLSFMGCLSVFAVQLYLGMGFQPLICLCSMGIIFGIYTSNRFTDTAEDFTNDIQKALFFQSRRIWYALAIGALVVSMGILLVQEKLNWLHFLLIGMGFCYSYRLIPWYSPGQGMQLIRIKEMTFVKNLAVSLLWGGSVFMVPILYSSVTVANLFVLIHLGLGLFLSTLNNTLFDDILDEDGDRVAGIKTLPTTLGSRNSLRLLWALDIAWILWIALCLSLGKLNLPHSAFLMFLGAFPIGYMSLSRQGKAPKAWIDFLMESDLLYFSLGLMFLSLV
ncbi:MAG: UbiA family prenyltransferase [Fibrobacteria bacterium]